MSAIYIPRVKASRRAFEAGFFEIRIAIVLRRFLVLATIRKRVCCDNKG